MSSAPSNFDDRSLVAFAFLADHLAGGGDIAAGFVPLFKAVTKPLAGKRFNAKQLCDLLAQYYDLDIHPYAIEDQIPRLIAAGILVKKPNTTDVSELVYGEVAESFDEIDDVAIDNVVLAFIRFAQVWLEPHGIKPNDEELRSAFLKRLRRSDFLGILAKPKAPTLSARPVLTLKRDTDATDSAQAPQPLDGKFDVLVASFLLDAKTSHQELYDLIIKTATGVLVSEVILNFRDPTNIKDLAGITVLLDAPFLMALLDLALPVRHTYASRLLAQLKEKGATVATFRHSIEEFRDSLKSVLANYEKGQAYGETASRLRNTQFRIYAGTLVTAIEPRLRDIGIEVQADPIAPQYRHFTDESADALRGRIGFHENALARDRDVKSIANVVRLRTGISVDFDQIRSCRYVFLSENDKLARLATKHLVTANIYREGQVPPCLTDRYFAGLLWIMYGGSSSNLTESRFLANCARAVTPSPDLIGKMHKILSEMNSEYAEHFKAMMTSERCGHYFMQLTLGDPLLLTDDNAEQVLQDLEKVVGERIETQKNEEIAALKSEYSGKLDEQSERFTTLLSERDTAHA
jgi:hypothetical protein